MHLETIGVLLRTARKLRGYSQKEFAGRLDCSVSQISRIESGDRTPSLGLFLLMAGELSLDVGVLNDFRTRRSSSVADAV